MAKEKIGTAKTSYHASGSINKDNSAKNSGTYENTGGVKTWTIGKGDDKKTYIKDDDVWVNTVTKKSPGSDD